MPNPPLPECAKNLRRKIASGRLVLSVGEWQTVMDALDLVSGESEDARQRDIETMVRRIRKPGGNP